MEKEEELLLRSLGWKGKGLIQCAIDAASSESVPANAPDRSFFIQQFYFIYQLGLSSFVHQFGGIRCYEKLQFTDFTGALLEEKKREGSLRFYKPKFNYIFCDMDGEIQQKNVTLFKIIHQLITTSFSIQIQAHS